MNEESVGLGAARVVVGGVCVEVLRPPHRPPEVLRVLTERDRERGGRERVEQESNRCAPDATAANIGSDLEELYLDRTGAWWSPRRIGHPGGGPRIDLSACHFSETALREGVEGPRTQDVTRPPGMGEARILRERLPNAPVREGNPVKQRESQVHEADPRRRDAGRADSMTQVGEAVCIVIRSEDRDGLQQVGSASTPPAPAAFTALFEDAFEASAPRLIIPRFSVGRERPPDQLVGEGRHTDLGDCAAPVSWASLMIPRRTSGSYVAKAIAA